MLTARPWLWLRLRLSPLAPGPLPPAKSPLFGPPRARPHVLVPSSLPSTSLHARPSAHALMYMGLNHPLTHDSSHSSSSSTATATNSASDRRALFRKENHFLDRYGSKPHAYDRDKAPYPRSFDRDAVEVYVSPLLPLSRDALAEQNAV